MTAWIDQLISIRALREELAKYGGMMDPYARSVITREIASKVDAVRPAAVNGALADWRGTIQKYQDARAKFEQARQKEADSYDAGKLAGEINLLQTMIGLNSKQASPFKKQPDGLQKIYQDAANSADKHRRRAAAELFAAMDGGKDLAMVELVRKAKNDLATMLDTPEVKQAAQGVIDGLNELESCREYVTNVADILGESRDQIFVHGALREELNRVRVMPDGNVEIKEVNNGRSMAETQN